MVYGRFCREVRPPTRRPGLLQGGWPEPSHNPRGHILRPRLHPPRLDVLGRGRRESDECRGWLLRSAKAHLEHFSISARYDAPRVSLVSPEKGNARFDMLGQEPSAARVRPSETDS